MLTYTQSMLCMYRAGTKDMVCMVTTGSPLGHFLQASV